MTDSALIDECTDDIVIDDLTVRNSTGICFERVRSRKYMSIRTFLTKLIIVQTNESLRWSSVLLLLLLLLIDSARDEEIDRGPSVYIDNGSLYQTSMLTKHARCLSNSSGSAGGENGFHCEHILFEEVSF